jgi:hypothetical protein
MCSIVVEMGTTFGGGQKKQKKESAQDMHLQWELRNFVKSISHDKRIKSMLVNEKLYVVNLFVNAEKVTDPLTEEYIKQLEKNATTTSKVNKKSSLGMGFVNIAASLLGTDAGSGEVRTNVVTWENIVVRMIKHVDFKNASGNTDANSGVCAHILHLFDLYLHGDDDGLEQKQNKLNEWGVLQLCYRLIKTGKNAPLFSRALKLMNSLLTEGNVSCQESLQQYMISSAAGDTDGQFFKSIFDTIEAATIW